MTRINFQAPRRRSSRPWAALDAADGCNARTVLPTPPTQRQCTRKAGYVHLIDGYSGLASESSGAEDASASSSNRTDQAYGLVVQRDDKIVIVAVRGPNLRRASGPSRP